MRTPLFVANWKMHKTAPEADAFFLAFPSKVQDIVSGVAQVAVAPQAISLLSAVEKLKSGSVSVAAQNCGQAATGAFTGEISPKALKEAGVHWAILGHSERRWVYGESNALVASRTAAAFEAGLSPILCVGERLVDRKEGKTFIILEEQLGIIEKSWEAHLDRLVVAYEPVWAIGTGETATPAQAQEAHAFIRQWFHDRFSAGVADRVRILYGGSAKADNAQALMSQPDVDGLLVGGASLDALGFAELVRNGVSSAP